MVEERVWRGRNKAKDLSRNPYGNLLLDKHRHTVKMVLFNPNRATRTPVDTKS